MNIKNNKKSQISIEKIKKSISYLLKNDGYESLTITNICKNAHINRTTFYAHFDSVNDALYQICEAYIVAIYDIFMNETLPYKARVKKSIEIIKKDLDFFSYIFTNVSNLELKVIEMIENSNNNSLVHHKNLEKAKLSLAYIISGFVGIAKIYFLDISQNKTEKISVDDFADLICNVVNKNNPYFIIK
ncbi:MAG: TetR/AcrR family transcriptional regulator [Clostridia bacterium]|nr:TetR/AcrR family transcriptional regulator [Clostridia bacterium]